MKKLISMLCVGVFALGVFLANGEDMCLDMQTIGLDNALYYTVTGSGTETLSALSSWYISRNSAFDYAGAMATAVWIQCDAGGLRYSLAANVPAVSSAGMFLAPYTVSDQHILKLTNPVNMKNLTMAADNPEVSPTITVMWFYDRKR